MIKAYLNVFALIVGTGQAKYISLANSNPQACGLQEFFDTTILQCVTCPGNTQKAKDGK